LVPAFSKAYYNRGNVYSNRNQYKNAIEDYTTSIGVEPNFAEAYYNRANAFAKIGQYAKAIADYDSVIRLRPGDADAYENRETVRALMRQVMVALSAQNGSTVPSGSRKIRPDISDLRGDARSADQTGK
jgi:tetratricopeptide (TPR) repeat protein